MSIGGATPYKPPGSAAASVPTSLVRPCLRLLLARLSCGKSSTDEPEVKGKERSRDLLLTLSLELQSFEFGTLGNEGNQHWRPVGKGEGDDSSIDSSYEALASDEQAMPTRPSMPIPGVSAPPIQASLPPAGASPLPSVPSSLRLPSTVLPSLLLDLPRMPRR